VLTFIGLNVLISLALVEENDEIDAKETFMVIHGLVLAPNDRVFGK